MKFWRSSKDRFFLWLTAAFTVFAVGWVILAFAPRSGDHNHYVFVPRLIGFLLIIAGVLDKNRQADR